LPAVDEKVPVDRSIESAVLIELSEAGRIGVTKYAYCGTWNVSVYSFAAPLSKSKTDMPMSADEGSDSGVFIMGHAYARRLASFAAPLQHAAVVQTELKQLQLEA